MSQFNVLQASFKNGEISPKFNGRKDLEEYKTACAKMENFYPRHEGGFSKRMGSEFVADVSALATVGGRGPALLPFISSKEEAYCVVIQPEGNLASVKNYIKIYKNDGTVCTISPFLDVEAPDADLDPKEFDFAQIGDVMWITHKSGQFRPMLIAKRSVTTDDFAIIDLSLALSTVVENQNLTQVNTVLKQPYRDTNISPITMTPSAVTGSITITSSVAFFDTDMTNALIRINHAGVEGVARLGTFTSSTVMNAVVLINFGAITASDDWAESSWSIYRGYPRTVTVYQQRLVWGGNLAEPDTLWFSRLGNAFMMMQDRFAQDFAGDTTGVNYFIPAGLPADQAVYDGKGIQILEDDAFSIRIASNEGNPVAWLRSGRNLQAGTLGGEYVIGQSGPGLSILTVTVQKHTSYGGAPRKAVTVGNETLFIMRDGYSLRNFKYNDSNGSFVSGKVSVFGEHLRRLGDDLHANYTTLELLDAAYQPSLDIVWLINSFGRLIGVNYSPEFGANGWFRTLLPNSDFAPNDNPCRVWGVTVLPNEEGSFDDLWIVVERENTNGLIYTLERVGVQFSSDSLEDPDNYTITENIPLYLDSAVIVDNSAHAGLTIIPGLDHLEGVTVTMVYRGVKLGTYIVDGSGNINLSAAHTAILDADPGMVLVGVPFSAEFESLDPEAGGDYGFSEGMTQRIDRVYVRVNNSKNVKVGNLTTQDPLKLLDLDSTDAQDLVSGLYRQEIPNSNDYNQQIKIVSEEPHPCDILSIALLGSSSNG